MTSQPGIQTIAIRILPNISRSKGNQTMKFGQLIEYILINIFLEKSCKNCAEGTIPKPFSKKIKFEHLSGSISYLISWIISLDLFLLCAKLRTMEVF